MNSLHRIAGVVAGAVAATALSLPGAQGAAAAPKGRPASNTAMTWTAPWAATIPALGTCTPTSAECASATTNGEVRAVVGPADAGPGPYPAYRERRAAVVFSDDLDNTRTTSRTYNATVVLHDVTTSGAGYADLEAKLDSAPAACAGWCRLSDGRVRVAAGDRTLSGDATVALSFRLNVDTWSGLTELPPGAYAISIGVIAGIVENVWESPRLLPCVFTWSCYWSMQIHAGVGAAEIAASVQKVAR